MALLAPSILSADFSRLGEQIRSVEAAGVTMLHLDVMDGHFVPNLTIGPPVVASIRRATKLKLDVHLMIEHADAFLVPFIQAGADLISVHLEACPHLHRTIAEIKAKGRKAGIVLNPATTLDLLDDILPEADYVLLMSVNPGWGGQKFIPHVKDKIAALRSRIRQRGLNTLIEVDGGVTKDNIASLAQAGADMIVAGSAVFGAPDPAVAAAELAALARTGP
ncbi:MAG TPA: ribulose-phosphate 3-epimerase [Candidatus Polarisedimenticolia bacterium]|nr:ribulose-phosphate 3-epimerase [Candidatus Polarisedimenticolia bacterium]